MVSTPTNRIRHISMAEGTWSLTNRSSVVICGTQTFSKCLKYERSGHQLDELKQISSFEAIMHCMKQANQT